MDRTLIDEYGHGAGKLAQAIQGLTPADCLQPPPAGAGPAVGKWTIQQVVVHLADAELAFADRIKRLIATDDPVLQEWDENAFVEKLAYDQQSASDAAEIVRLVRSQLTRVLQTQPAEVLSRAGRHTSRGRQTLADVLATANKHLDHHLTFITAKREAMGKLMW